MMYGIVEAPRPLLPSDLLFTLRKKQLVWLEATAGALVGVAALLALYMAPSISGWRSK